jgi:hypothetical protein
LTVRVEGVTTTPGGRPLREMFTGSANPFTAAVVTVKDRADPPLCSETELGAAVIVKSGRLAGEMESAAVAVWDVSSAEAVTVTIAELVGAAESEALSMNWPNWPGASESAEGEAVTPVGRPLREIFTEPVKPFTPPVVTERARATPPLWRETVFGAAAMVKLGKTAGPEDVPQPRANTIGASNARRGVLIN